jgi:hypothetical protein
MSTGLKMAIGITVGFFFMAMIVAVLFLILGGEEEAQVELPTAAPSLVEGLAPSGSPDTGLVAEPEPVKEVAPPPPSVKQPPRSPAPVVKPAPTRDITRSIAAPKPDPAPSVAAATAFPGVVKFVAQGQRVKLICPGAEPQKVEFVGTTRLTFSTITTCRVTIEEIRGAITVRSPGTVNCVLVGTEVACGAD